MNKAQWNITIFQWAEKLLGRSAIEKLYLKRCVQIYVRNSIIFIHVPKAAGTSISYEVLGQRAGHFSAMDVRDYLGTQAFDHLFSFSVVRHPTTRLLSAYRYARQGGGSEGGVRRLPEYSGLPFRSFEAFVMEWLSSIDLLNAPVIFRPQYTFVCDREEQILVNHIAKLEHLSDLSELLSIETGRTISFEKRNESDRGKSDTISPEVHQRILELYHKDFDIFGYTPYTS